MQEKKLPVLSGLMLVIAQLLLFGYAAFAAYHIQQTWAVVDFFDFVIPAICLICFFIIFGGYVTINPNEYKVYQFMGKYKGVVKENGFWFTNPFYGVAAGNSFKIDNYQTPVLTVNEKGGAPIEIAAMISWRIKDTYKYNYAVEDAHTYVHNQFEISLRQHAKLHTYSELSNDDHEFVEDLTEKVEKSGAEILEAKITHLSYSAEIASAMLQKQQASSMSDAKQIIVENAVAIAKHACDSINGDMLPQDKSKFIANLIVVLCSDKSVSPTLSVSNNDH